jgi:hypothetical protein
LEKLIPGMASPKNHTEKPGPNIDIFCYSVLKFLTTAGTCLVTAGSKPFIVEVFKPCFALSVISCRFDYTLS